MSFVQSDFQSYQSSSVSNQESSPAYLESISPANIKMRAYMLGTVASLVTTQFGDMQNPLLRKRLVAEFQPGDFVAQLGERFHMQNCDGLLTLATLEAIDVMNEVDSADLLLFFSKSQGAEIVDGVYTFAHTQLGLFELVVALQSSVDGKTRFVAKITH